jgi:photosystem II stability/assembly factor-like uncharacterized protein
MKKTSKNFHFIIKLSIILLIYSAQSFYAQWKRIESPEIITPISTFAVAAIGDTLFAGTYRSTIYRSTNNGLSWSKSDSGISSIYQTFGFLIAGDAIYAASEEGIFRSTNMGESWELKNDGLHSASYQMVYSIVQSGDQLFAATDFGVYRSSNSGDYWYPSNGDSSYWPVFDITVLNNFLFAGSAINGMFRSNNNGITWSPVNNGLPYNSSGSIQRINSLFADEDNIYAGTNQWGIYFSSDNGDTWLPDTAGFHRNGIGNIFPIYSIEKIGGKIFAGTQDDGIYYQTGPGEPWFQVNTGLPENSYILSIAGNKYKIFAATFMGLYSSSVDNISWQPLFTEFPGKVTASVLSSSGNNLFISASSDYYNGRISGIFYSPDKGNNWFQDSVLSISFINDFASFGSDSIYALGSGIFFSSNNGDTWIRIDSNLCSSLIKNSDTLFTCYGNEFLQFGETGRISLSPDNGKSWKEIWKADTAIYAVAKIGNYLFAGGLHGVFRSSNTGSSWSGFNKGLPSGISISSFKTAGENLFLSSSRGIYMSSDFGDNWISLNDGLPVDTAGYNIIHLLTFNGLLYTGTKNGVYFSANLGESWVQRNNGLSGDALSINSITVHGSDLVAASKEGLWERKLTDINSVENNITINYPAEYRLSQNYPNPFNPSTLINFTIPQRSFVSIKVYDALGREVNTLFSEEKPAGVYEVNFNGSGFSSGVYFYQLRAGNYILTKKMLLIK